MPALFDGHPDDWWGGHSWDTWWRHLRRDQRTELLELGWGESTNGRSLLVDTVRGATQPVQVDLQSDERMRPKLTLVRHEPTDGFLVWMEEKRALLSAGG